MRKITSKLFRTILITILCVSVLAGCGNQDGSQSGSSQSGSSQPGQSSSGSSISLPGSSASEIEIPDKISEDIIAKRDDTEIIGMQFYQGEAVEIRRDRASFSKFKPKYQDIFLYDLQGEMRLRLADAKGEYSGKWYFTEEGYCLLAWKSNIIRIEQDGSEVFNKQIENGVVDICQLNDGRVMLIMKDASDNMKLAELNPDTGGITKYNNVALSKDRRQYLGVGEEGLLLANSAGIWAVNPETGELSSAASWNNYDYSLGFLVQDFRLSADGIIDVALNDTAETVLPKNIEDIRVILTLWDLDGSAYYQEFVDRFNHSNSTYFVEVQKLEEGVAEEDFLARNETLLMEGRGADIVLSNSVNDIYSLIQKGVFEDLAPYMEADGIYQDEYFPGAFRFRDGDNVYGISIYASATGLAFSEKILEDGEIPGDIEALVDALLNYSGDEVFHSSWESEEVLHYFLCGSEDLWGMIDWESGTCDFDSVLFAKMLEAAKLFGNGGEKDLPALAEAAGSKFYNLAYQELLDETGMVYVGCYFDDGCFPAADPYLEFAINSNSVNKEGAWEFLSFLLSEEVQSVISYQFEPVHRASFEVTADREIAEGSVAKDKSGMYVYKPGSDVWSKLHESFQVGNANTFNKKFKSLYDLTAEKAAEIKGRINTAVTLPERTKGILQIIREEASGYFDEKVNAVDVCENIQARVQQYLDSLNINE